jgi:hypothetical protein
VDELVFKSGAIVEGRLIDDSRFNITTVYQGELNAGYVINLDYLAGDRSQLKRQKLGAGNRLFLFLARAPSDLDGNVASRWPDSPLDDGVKWIVRGRVIDNQVFSNWPQPLVAGSTAGARPVGAYRTELRQAIARVTHFKRQLLATPSDSDISWLLPPLTRSDRSHLMRGYFDEWMYGAAVKYLCDVRDPVALDQAMTAAPAAAPALYSGFASPAGRRYLLKQLDDPANSAFRRGQLVSAITAAGPSFMAMSYRAASNRPNRDVSAGPGNDSYLTHVARLAVSDRLRPELARQLVCWLRDIVVSNRGDVPPDIQEDLDGAAAALSNGFFDPRTSDEMRFWIEEAVISIGLPAYEKLGSKVGLIPSRIVRLVERAGIAPAIEWEYYWFRHPHITAIELLLEPLDSTRPPKSIPIMTNEIGDFFGRGMPNGSNTETAWLPADVPPGRYRASMRFKNGNDVVSEGHALEITLHSPKAAPARPIAVAPPPIASTAPIRKWFENLREWGAAIIFAAIALLILSYFIRSRRRVRQFTAGKCIHCGYDLRATSGRCPECGNAPPPFLRMGILRRRLYGGCSAALALICLLSLILWVRSHWVSDCLVNTTRERADAFYSAAGALVLEQPCVRSETGWTYERSDPAEMVRTPADAGAAADWTFLGAQRATRVGITVIPLWQITCVASLLGYGFWWSSRAIRSTISTGAAKTPEIATQDPGA